MFLATSAVNGAGPSASHTPMNCMSDTTTITGRVRRGTKGKREHGCVFCGKVYSRREHLKRHQTNHKIGANACPAPDCGCTFHSTLLLERHRFHEWPFPFQLSEAYIFRCPSLPQASSAGDRGLRSPKHPSSPRATRVTACENAETTGSEGYESCGPTPSHESPASLLEASIDQCATLPKAQTLQVPSRSPLNNTHGREQIHRALPRNVTSSSAVLQDNYHDPTTSTTNSFVFPPTGSSRNFVNSYSPQTGFQSEGDQSARSFQGQTYGQSQHATDFSRSSVGLQPPTWHEVPRHNMPISLVAEAPSQGWTESDTHHNDLAPTYMYSRHFSHPVAMPELHDLKQDSLQQGMNHFELQDQSHGQTHSQHDHYSAYHTELYSDERARRNDAPPGQSIGNFDPNLTNRWHG